MKNKIQKINSKTVISLSTLLVAIIWIWLGVTKYGLMSEDNVPLPGMFPSVVAVVLGIASIIGIFQSFQEEKASYEKQAFYVAVGIFGVVGLTLLIGMLPSLLIFFVAWVKCVEKMTTKTCIIATAIMILLVYGVFVMWLGVPFPKGMLLEII